MRALRVNLPRSEAIYSGASSSAQRAQTTRQEMSARRRPCPACHAGYYASHWRSLDYFNLYR